MRATFFKVLAAGVAAVALPAAVLTVGSRGAEAADEMPSSIVEDYSYPGAAAIPEITLIKGDGRITLVPCDTANPDLITVESIGRTVFCFAVQGDSGWLSLRLDRVFLVGAGDQKVAAKVTANGVTDTVNIGAGGIESIGVEDPDFGVLLELRATPKA
ncbi:hypothetical protein [Actinoplanes philippinensis]|uniref:hypothetical protein n=1 Tax=Actinoplanes philippinensis TaxID=35752 RepID=UPI0033E26BC4